MKGELFINGQDAYTTWGLSLDETALSTLMTPSPLKALVRNKSQVEDGVEVLGVDSASQATFRPRIDSREITLVINITGDGKDGFLGNYSRFCDVLARGVLNISTIYQPNVVYKMIYQSCQQFSQFQMGIGKFTLRLEEPNPTDREA